MSDSQMPLPRRSIGGSGIPLPLAIAGIFMLFSGIVSGGWSAGDGFFYGLVLGFVFSLVAHANQSFEVDRPEIGPKGSLEASTVNG